MLQRLVGDGHMGKDLRAGDEYSKAPTSCFIPLGFVGTSFTLNNLMFTAFFLLFSLG